MKMINLSTKKISVLPYQWCACDRSSLAVLSVLDHKKYMGGLMWRIADCCTFSLGRDFPVLLSKETDPVHGQPVPDAG